MDILQSADNDQIVIQFGRLYILNAQFGDCVNAFPLFNCRALIDANDPKQV